MPPGSQSFVVNVPTGQLSAAGRVAQISAAEQRGMPLTLRTAASAEPENTGDLLTDGDGNVIEDGEGHPISTGPEPKMATISSDFSSPVETLAQVGQDVTVQLTGIEVKGEVGSLAPSASVGRRGSGRNWRDRGPGRFGGSPPGWHRRQCEYHARPAIPYAI